MIKWLLRCGAVAGALTAIGVLWVSLGLPTIATGSDIKRLDRYQADIAVETYTTKLNGLIISAPPANTPASHVWDEAAKQTRDQLKRAEDRKIELGK